MTKSRVEALTDGIIAIAATIMVLELGIPSSNDWSGLLEIKHTVLSYVNSFFMIYLFWSMHHDLFKKAETITRKTFVVNGIWTLILTFIPFTTTWVGDAPDATVPEFLYALNILLCVVAVQWLEYNVRKDNPDGSFEKASKTHYRFILCGILAVCIVLAFVMPRCSIYLMIITALVSVVWSIIRKRRTSG